MARELIFIGRFNSAFPEKIYEMVSELRKH